MSKTTVANLIKRLEKMPPNAEVLIEAEDEGLNIVNSVRVERTCNEGEVVCRVYCEAPQSKPSP